MINIIIKYYTFSNILSKSLDWHTYALLICIPALITVFVIGFAHIFKIRLLRHPSSTTKTSLPTKTDKPPRYSEYFDKNQNEVPPPAYSQRELPTVSSTV